MNDRPGSISNSKTVWVAVGLLLVAFALRTHAITEVPPGLTHDEVSELDVAAQVRDGDWRLLYTRGYGVEPGYYPLLSASQAVWGVNPLAMRLPSVFAGMIGLACSYVLACRLFGRRVGLIALGAATVTWWSIVMGRAIEREILEVPTYALALYAFWRGIEPALSNGGRPITRLCIAGGLALGVAQYVHTIPRGLFIVFVMFGVYLAVFHRPAYRRAWRSIAAFIIVAEVTAAPLLVAATLEPEVDRLPPDQYSQSDVGATLVERLSESAPQILGQFAFVGDDSNEFNIPYRPIFEPLGAGLFALGLLAALRFLRRPAHALALIVFGVSLLPSLLLDPHFPFARLISAQTVAFAFVGLGGDVLGRGLDRLVSTRSGLLLNAGLLTLFGINLIWTAQDMFVVWPGRNPTRSTYQADLRDVGRYLAAQTSVPPLAQCTLWIVFPWAPKYHSSVAQASLPYLYPRRDFNIRWHDCRYALVIPASGQFVFVHPDIQPLSEYLGRFLKTPWLDGARPVPGQLSMLEVDARQALADQMTVWRDLPVAWPPEAAVSTPIQLPINFGNALDLIGYRFEPLQVKAGEAVAVITYWRVTGAVADDTVLFTHVYRTPTEVMAQQDQLDVGGSSLKVGDVFIQQHEFITVPPETQPGAYQIGVGLYHKETGERWPILIDGAPVADRLFLDQVRVSP